LILIASIYIFGSNSFAVNYISSIVG